MTVNTVVSNGSPKFFFHTAVVGDMTLKATAGEERLFSTFRGMRVVAGCAGHVIALLKARGLAKPRDLIVAVHANLVLLRLRFRLDIVVERFAGSVGKWQPMLDSGARVALRADLDRPLSR
jgi:hypothetical protein